MSPEGGRNEMKTQARQTPKISCCLGMPFWLLPGERRPHVPESRKSIAQSELNIHPLNAGPPTNDMQVPSPKEVATAPLEVQWGLSLAQQRGRCSAVDH